MHAHNIMQHEKSKIFYDRANSRAYTTHQQNDELESVNEKSPL
jgi:hypothetical protein